MRPLRFRRRNGPYSSAKFNSGRHRCSSLWQWKTSHTVIAVFNRTPGSMAHHSLVIQWHTDIQYFHTIWCCMTCQSMLSHYAAFVSLKALPSGPLGWTPGPVSSSGQSYRVVSVTSVHEVSASCQLSLVSDHPYHNAAVSAIGAGGHVRLTDQPLATCHLP